MSSADKGAVQFQVRPKLVAIPMYAGYCKLLCCLSFLAFSMQKLFGITKIERLIFALALFKTMKLIKLFLRIFMIWIFWPGAFVKILNSDKIVLFTLTHDKIHFAWQ